MRTRTFFTTPLFLAALSAGFITVAPPPSFAASLDAIKPKVSDILGERGGYGCLNKDEEELYNLVMAYRKSRGLPKIPLSRSLSKVARIHALDLELNRPDTATFDDSKTCNMHSWSNQGFWTPVCYNADHRYAKQMWNKPAEITGGTYKSEGFEIAFTISSGATPEEALKGWQSSPNHNAVILSQGPWTKIPFKAMGIGLSGPYAVIWFGATEDPAGAPDFCSSQIDKQTSSCQRESWH